MHFTTALAVLIAATGIAAAPTKEKRLDAVPLSIFLGTGCNSNPIAVTTAYVPTDGNCFSFSPIISGNTDSGIIDQTILRTLPAGCKREYISRSQQKRIFRADSIGQLLLTPMASARALILLFMMLPVAVARLVQES
jgi:hypothetical protein